MNQIRSYKKFIILLAVTLSGISACTFSKQSQNNNQTTQSTTRLQQFERSIAHLAEELLEYGNDVDELVPLLLEIGVAYWASHIVLPKKSIKRRGLKSLLQRIGIGYVLRVGATIMHETGHAIAAKLFKCSNIEINLGTTSNQKNKPQTQIGSFTYTIQSPWMSNGNTTYTKPRTGLSNLQEAFIAISGGSAATAGVYIMKVIIHLQQNRHRKYRSAKDRITAALKESLTLDAITTLELTNMLVPLDAANDGTKFWNAILKK